MINKIQFEIDIIEKSNIPYVAAGTGIWINSKRETFFISGMELSDIENCVMMLKIKTDCFSALNQLEKDMKETVNTSNRNQYLEYLEKLKKNKLIEMEYVLGTK